MLCSAIVFRSSPALVPSHKSPFPPLLPLLTSAQCSSKQQPVVGQQAKYHHVLRPRRSRVSRLLTTVKSKFRHPKLCPQRVPPKITRNKVYPMLRPQCGGPKIVSSEVLQAKRPDPVITSASPACTTARDPPPFVVPRKLRILVML